MTALMNLTTLLRRPSARALLAIGLTLGLGACKPFELDPPPGFAEVQDYERDTRMKASDNVGIRVRSFGNVRGGTLAYWAEDLVTKYGRRGYHLESQAPVTSKNGKTGTRFDFSYTSPGDDVRKFDSVVLFATDDNIIVLEIAGDMEHASRHRAKLAEIVGDLKVRGCKLGGKICGSPQPGALKTPPKEGLGLSDEDFPSEQPADVAGEQPSDAAPAEGAPAGAAPTEGTGETTPAK